MAHVLERSPKVFYNLDEESLRTHFLVQLNGHYDVRAELIPAERASAMTSAMPLWLRGAMM